MGREREREGEKGGRSAGVPAAALLSASSMMGCTMWMRRDRLSMGQGRGREDLALGSPKSGGSYWTGTDPHYTPGSSG